MNPKNHEGPGLMIHPPVLYLAALVTDGPYRWSRNPAYIALTLWYLGTGFLLNNGWILLLVLPLLLITDQWVIRKEERHLEAQFGEEYRRYKSTVHRWL